MSAAATASDRSERVTGLVRLINVAFRRYAREPESRALSAKLLLQGAVSLYAAETSTGEAAVTAAEAVSALAQADRSPSHAG